MLARRVTAFRAADIRELQGGSPVAPAARTAGARVANGMVWRCLLGALALLGLLQLGALLRAPTMWVPEMVTLRLAPGESVTLEPLAPAMIQRDAGGRWLLAPDAARAPAVSLLRAGAAPESLASMALQDGFLALPGGNLVARLPASRGSVAFKFAGSTWGYDGFTLLRNGQAQQACPDARWNTRLASSWNRVAPKALSLARPLSLGGSLHCGNRIGIAGVLPDAASISRADDGSLRITDLEHAPRALDGVHAIGIGAMRLGLAPASLPVLASPLGLAAGDAGRGAAGASAQVETLVLRPERRLPQFSTPNVELPPQAEWGWRTRALWPALPSGALQTSFMLALCLALAAGALALFVRRRQHTASVPHAACAAALTVAGLLAMALQRIGHPPAVALSLLLAALSIGCWLSAPGARSIANACATLLVAAGLLVQLELSLGGGDLRYAQKAAALLATGLGALTLWRLAPAGWRAAAGTQRSIERFLLALAALALAALAAQVLWGDETGVFDMQPVELAKLTLGAMAAHCLALRFGWHEGAHHGTALARWLALAAPVLLFLALLALALVKVDDFSPLILLLLWAGGSTLAYACASGQRVVAALLVAAGAATALGVGALHNAGPAALPSGFYADRFQVWLAPGEHPHTGQQLLRAASAIAQGGLAGADSSFGLRSAGVPVGEAAAIPAVQDDFAPSFFINRHGLLAALALWLVQAAFLGGLLWQALHAHRQAGAARAYQSAWGARFRCFALCGGAAFVAGHFLLSWATNLSILPVMGQPMPFLSAGGSHLLFFLLPLLGLSAASNEE